MPVEFSLDIYFGTTDSSPLATLARQIFETFPAPLMRVEFARDGDWTIAAIRAAPPPEALWLAVAAGSAHAFTAPE